MLREDLWLCFVGTDLEELYLGRVLRDCCVEKVSEVLLYWVGFYEGLRVENNLGAAVFLRILKSFCVKMILMGCLAENIDDL